MKDETFILLAGFNLIDMAKKYLPYKLIDEQMKRNPNWQERFEKVLQSWRFDDSLLFDFYSVLREFFPNPIPFSLFFSYTKLNDVKNIKWIGDLADKWLMDIFSNESFYKRNKEYFTRAEVKHFLVCDWVKSNETKPKMCNYSDLVYYFFDTKIKANNLKLSPSVLINVFKRFIAHNGVLKDFFIFIHDNKKFIRDEEIYSICSFINNEYIKKEKNFDFKRETYKSLKQLTDTWYVSSVLEELYVYFDAYKYNKICKDYIKFICRSLICENIKRFSHSEITDFGYYFRLNSYPIDTSGICDHNICCFDDTIEYYDKPNFFFADIFLPLFSGNDYNDVFDIFDFLKAEYILTGMDFNFDKHTWRSLKCLSNEWYDKHEILEDKIEDLEFQELLDAKWEKSELKDFTYEKDGIKWTITEITSGKLLYEEGELMGHCCFDYLNMCIGGESIIFSVKYDDKKYEERTATIEISKSEEAKQIRGENNLSVDRKTKKIIDLWAYENKIDISHL